MTDQQVRPDSEQLRAFEQLMHQQGAAAFGAGIAPWESWDDADLGSQWQHHGGADHPLHITRNHRSTPALPFGQRLLAGITRLLVLVLLTGIGGVYFSSLPVEQQLAQGIQPAPIVLTRSAPAVIETTEPDSLIATDELPEFDDFPAPAAGPDGRPAIEVVTREPAAAQDTLAVSGPQDNPVVPAGPEMPGWHDENAPAYGAGNAGLAAQETATWQPAQTESGTAGNAWQSQQEAVDADAGQNAARQAVMEPPLPGSGSESGHAALASVPENGGVPEPEAQQVSRLAAYLTSPATQVTAPETESAAGGSGIDMVDDPVSATPTVTRLEPTEPREAAATDPMHTPAREEVADAPVPGPASPATDDTPLWVVNLAAYNTEAMARRIQEKFHKQGVETELFHITVNGKDMVRLRTTSLDSYQEAQDWSAMVEERLGLKGTWVSKR